MLFFAKTKVEVAKLDLTVLVNYFQLAAGVSSRKKWGTALSNWLHLERAACRSAWLSCGFHCDRLRSLGCGRLRDCVSLLASLVSAGAGRGTGSGCSNKVFLQLVKETCLLRHKTEDWILPRQD